MAYCDVVSVVFTDTTCRSRKNHFEISIFWTYLVAIWQDSSFQASILVVWAPTSPWPSPGTGWRLKQQYCKTMFVNDIMWVKEDEVCTSISLDFPTCEIHMRNPHKFYLHPFLVEYTNYILREQILQQLWCGTKNRLASSTRWPV